MTSTATVLAPVSVAADRARRRARRGAGAHIAVAVEIQCDSPSAGPPRLTPADRRALRLLAEAGLLPTLPLREAG